MRAAESANFPTTELSIELVLRREGDIATVAATGQSFPITPDTLGEGEERLVQVRVEDFASERPLFSRYEMPDFETTEADTTAE